MLQTKVIAALGILLVILGLGLSARHYRNAWIDATVEIAVLKSEQAQLQLSANKCSDGVKNLGVESSKKEEAVKKAQNEVNTTTKVNEKTAQDLLGAGQKGDSCKAAVKLYQDYKSKKEVK